MSLKKFIRFLKTSVFGTPLLILADFILWFTDTLAIWFTPIHVSSTPTLLIIKLDVLGDYLLFRPYLKTLKESSIYKDHRFVFFGNVGVKSLAELSDRNVFDEFLWTDIYKLSTQPIYRFKIARQLRRLGATTTFCPSYSRVLVLDDFMARVSGGKERVGCCTDYVNIKRWESTYGNKVYTRLIETDSGYLFEMERNRRILEKLLNMPVKTPLPHFDLSQVKAVDNLPKEFVILSLGAGQEFRVWPAERFVAIAKFLQSHYPSHTIILTGAPGEEIYSQKFLSIIKNHHGIEDKTGKLSLSQLIFTLSHAKLLIANETGIVHLAASTNTPTIVISQGKSLVRWHPYPAKIAPNIHHIYPFYIEENRNRLESIAIEFNPESRFSIEEITVDRLTKVIPTLIH